MVFYRMEGGVEAYFFNSHDPRAKLIFTSLRRIAHGIWGPDGHELGFDMFGNGCGVGGTKGRSDDSDVWAPNPIICLSLSQRVQRT